MDITLAYALWIWIFLVLLFALISIFVYTRTFRLLSAGAAVAAITAFLGAALLWQGIVFVAVFGLLLLIASLVSPNSENTHEAVYGIDRVVGKEAVVVVAIDPKVAQGRVRVEREIWPADSESGQPIPDGSTVQVLAIRGERVLVRPLPSEA